MNFVLSKSLQGNNVSQTNSSYVKLGLADFHWILCACHMIAVVLQHALQHQPQITTP